MFLSSLNYVHKYLKKKLCIFRRWLEKTEEIEQGEEAYDEIFTRRQETPRGKN